MKISYRNYPILEKLNCGSLGIMPMLEKDKFFFSLHGDRFVRNWKFYNKSFKSEINVITNPFLEASNKAWDKLIGLWGDILTNDTSDLHVNGCYLCGEFVYMINYEVRKGSEDQEVAFYMFDKKGIPLAMFIDSAKYKIYQNGWVSFCLEVDNDPKELYNYFYSKLAQVVVFKMFKSYADVETMVLMPKSKLKTFDCKYANDTNFTLNYLDSKWFTTLVKSDKFNVRGHFRLQPKKKDGQWTKELIWISEFEKNGYTSLARKLVNTISNA